MKRNVMLFLALVLLAAVAYLFHLKFIKQAEVHYHAGFKVYEDGKLQDFTGLKYMSFSPCTTGNSALPDNRQNEKAHLHDYVGDVVHVEAGDAVWGDLFKNIKYKINSSKSLVAYINGKKIDNVLDYPIKSYDSLVLLIGSRGEVSSYLKKAVKKDYIRKVEKKSESCGSGS